MAFKISDFYTRLSGDGARPNLFHVRMNIPSAVSQSMGPTGQNISAAETEFTFMCRTAQLPGSNLGTVVVPYFGREIKLAGNRVFSDWTVTIINDEDFLIRNTFEAWMNTINSHNNNIRLPGAVTPYTYQSYATVVQHAKDGRGGDERGIKSYQFVNIFPTEITPIDVDWGANDAIEEFGVTFQYQYWTTNSTAI